EGDDARKIIRAYRRCGCIPARAGNRGPAAAAGAPASTAAGADQPAARLAYLSRYATGRLRRRSRAGSDRASRPGPALRIRTMRVRIRASADGCFDDA